MTKVLVTGATGFLGGALVERLLVHGADDLRVTVRAGSPRARLDAAIARHPEARVEVVEANLIDREAAARAVADVDVILHLAATLRGAPADMFLNTVVATQHLLEAIGDRRPRFVLISSFSVYGVAELGRGALVDEDTPLEPHPELRDPYAQVKLRQEQLVRTYAESHGLPLVVLRPGVIFGPGGGAFSSRVGLQIAGTLLFLGGRNVLPLSYVDNCADAIVTAAFAPDAPGHVYNVLDDDLPTCAAYLQAYRAAVAPIRAVRVPYPALSVLARVLASYHRWSHGQLPAIFTPYKVRSTWGGNRFANTRIKALGWRQEVPTLEGLRRTFASLRTLP